MQPVSAAEFIAAGVSPEEANSLVAQHQAQTGRGDALALTARSASVPPQQAADAQARLNQIQTDRAAGKISDWEWRSKYEPEALQLRDRIVGGMGSSQLTQELNVTMAPPASPNDYHFPSSIAPLNDEAIAADNELKAALHSEGLPRYIVESIGSALATAAATRTDETPDQAQARIGKTRATLEQWYGRDTDANLALVDGVIDRLLAKGGATRDFVQAMAPHLDALSLDALVQFAKQRGTRR